MRSLCRVRPLRELRLLPFRPTRVARLNDFFDPSVFLGFWFFVILTSQAGTDVEALRGGDWAENPN